jgi:TIR domain
MLLTEQQVRQRLNREVINKGLGSITNPNLRESVASKILDNADIYQKSETGLKKEFDIFLSHSTKDKELVVGTKLILEDLGYSVYVDWIEDPKMDRSKVSKKTAAILQKRMQKCKSLFYAFSTNSSESKWMPWECGYFDGIKDGKVAVLPISSDTKTSFQGTEYLGLYYYITIQPSVAGPTRVYVRESDESYIIYESWMNNEKPSKR